jgi:hypothetical protein
MSGGTLAVRGALAALFALSATVRAEPRAAPASLPEASSLFPKIEGWKISDGPTKYTPDTLFEYIDGGAESFLQFDFQDLASATYANEGARPGKNRLSSRPSHDRDSTAAAKAEIAVDVYRHRDAFRAFGMYTQERPAGTTPLPIGIEAYAGPDYLEFVVGPYYVKLVQLGAKQPSFLRGFAEKVAAGLPGTHEAPAVFKCFPERGKRARAEKLMARDFLGHPFLHDAVAVPYQIGGASFRLFIVEGKDNADVRAMVQRYRSVARSPAVGGDSAGSEGTAILKDPLNGEVMLQWKGRWLWGAVDQPHGERQALVDELGRKLSALDKEDSGGSPASGTR